MIISHRHRFIFLKTHKTAGSSLETWLSGQCGPDDIVSTMDPEAPGHEPRNWIGNGPLGRLYQRHLRVRKIVHRDSRLLGKHYYQHMTASRIRKLIGQDVWNHYFKFCFERDPWDKVVSFYWWKMRNRDQAEPFSDWIRYKQLPVDSDLYGIDGQVAVDCIGRFEHLGDHFAAILRHLGLQVPDPLPRIKTGVNPSPRPYPDYYNDVDRDYIQQRFAPEIELMGYRFGTDAQGQGLVFPGGEPDSFGKRPPG